MPELNHTILIRIGNLREWEPLSRTHRLDYLWQNLTNEQEAALRGEFGLYLAKILAEKARKCIKTQQFPVRYAPLNPHYAAWKKGTGRKEGFWQNTGFLCDKLKVWRNSHDGSVNVGWPKSLKHLESNTPVVVIAEVLEKGSKKRNIPPRPLFTPLAEGLSKDVVRYFLMFLRDSRWRVWIPYVRN